MKRLICIFLLLVLALAFYGCHQIRSNTLQEHSNFFASLKSYEACVVVTFLKDKQPNKIKMKQIANMNGTYEMTIIEPEHLKDVCYKFDGHQVTEYFPNHGETVTEKANAAQNEILLTSFVRRYLTHDTIKSQEVQLDGKKVITYEMPIEGDFKYLSKEKIWLMKEKQIPLRMALYDDEGNITIEVAYENFKYNE